MTDDPLVAIRKQLGVHTDRLKSIATHQHNLHKQLEGIEKTLERVENRQHNILVELDEIFQNLVDGEVEHLEETPS